MRKISLSTIKNSTRRDELRANRGGSVCSFVIYMLVLNLVIAQNAATQWMLHLKDLIIKGELNF